MLGRAGYPGSPGTRAKAAGTVDPMAVLIAMFGGGDVGGLWSASDKTKLFQASNGTGAVTADGDSVGYLQDLSGKGNHLLQATSGQRPLYKTSGGLNWIDFDGAAGRWVRTAAGITLPQPYTVLASFRPRAWETNDDLVGPFAGANTVYVYQTGSSPGMGLYNGGGSGTSSAFTVGDTAGNDHVGLFEFNIGSSSIQHDADAATAVVVGGGSGNGLTVGSDNAGGTNINARLYGLMVIGRALTSGEKAAARTAMAALQGRVL